MNVAPPALGWRAELDPDILGVAADSREVRPGYVFVAVPGSKTDGRRFIEDAVARGAAAIVTDERSAERLRAGCRVPLLGDPDPRRRLAFAAAKLHGPQPETMAAVTGTNGKTTTASLTRQIWQHARRTAASIGTLGIETAAGLEPGEVTTPDPVTLHRSLARLAADGVDRAVIEASSHGLDQRRLDGVRLSAAAFTNLSQDHLDYHPDLASYLQAKLRLFSEVLPPGGVAVLNADVPEYEACLTAARARGHRILDYGRAANAIRLTEDRPLESGQQLSLEILGRRAELSLPLIGGFQAMNALAALGLALATGVEPEQAVAALEHARGVRGRVELVARLASGASVFVDYAHTPDGLEKVLAALRPHAAGRLLCVFGAGGDRDAAKRPKMGAVVAALADIAIVTDDNPRSEDPGAIRRAILEACPGALEIGSRAGAIAEAMRRLGPSDVLVIAGKGHEQGQVVGSTVLPFDDASVARAVARQIGEAE